MNHLVCLQCGKPLDMERWKRYGLNYMKKVGKGKFCSRECNSEFHKGMHNSPKTEFVKDDPRISGNNNHSWKGGKQQLEYGYIMILKPTHPCADHHGYVMEHRLVMEKHIGRYLNKEEVVHHKNGIRDDNRIENLLLFKNHSEHMKFEMPAVWQKRRLNEQAT